MEDLRKDNNARKQDGNKFNIFTAINGVFRYIKSKWKNLLFWLLFILAINVVFNPKNTAETLSSWYDDFVGTIIENSDE